MGTHKLNSQDLSLTFILSTFSSYILQNDTQSYCCWWWIVRPQCCPHHLPGWWQRDKGHLRYQRSPDSNTSRLEDPRQRQAILRRYPQIRKRQGQTRFDQGLDI